MMPTRALDESKVSGSNDLTLVVAVLRKDRKATAEFVAQYADSIYAYVRRRVVPHRDAVEDLVQEVFLAAWQALSSFRGEASLQAWLLGIARHKVEDYYRKRLREAEWPAEDDEFIEKLATIPLYEEQLDRAAAEESVRKVLASLSEPYRLALLWRYLENRSTREMAQLSGKTEKAVERLLARARESFRRRWHSAGR